MQEIRDSGLIPGSGRNPGGGRGNPLQCSCWRISWTDEPGWQQSIRSQRIRHDWATEQKGKLWTFYGSRFKSLLHWLMGQDFYFSLCMHIYVYTQTYTYMCACVLSHFSCVRLFATPWTAARQASLSFTISWSLVKLMSIESVMSSNHLILRRPFLFLPSIFPSIRIFSNEFPFSYL